jgi:hypothetical protein
MNKPNDVTGCFDASNCSTAIQRLTEEQRLELAACYAEYCGVDPQDRSEWRTEMVGAKKFLRELMVIWRKREKRGSSNR